MLISLIAAVSSNRAIGKDNNLLWHIRDDLKLFKKNTLGHVIIMGRKSFESIGKALPGRTNVVVTRKRSFNAEGVMVFHDLDAALDHFKSKEGEVFVIGGGEIYAQVLARADRLYISHVDVDVPEADTYFPIVNWDDWVCLEEEQFETSEKNDHSFTYKVYERASTI